MALVADISLALNSRKAMALLATPMAEAGFIVGEAHSLSSGTGMGCGRVSLQPCNGAARVLRRQVGG